MSALTFSNYKVTQIELKINKQFKFVEKVNINPNLNIKVMKVDKDRFVLILSALISNEKKDLPFNSKIVIEGFFKLDDWEKGENELAVKNNATAILFPYLRQTLSSVTQLAGLPPYHLPVINIKEMFEGKK